jgi:endonuclease/exonuclease/phosphatase (EEP) superfamily protein YafD
MLESLAWAAIALMGLLALTQAIGYGTSRIVAIPQSLTPHALAPAVPIAMAALATDHLAMAAVATSIVVAMVALAAPMVRRHADAVVTPDHLRLRIAHSNLLYTNERESPAGLRTLLDTDADILVLNEFTLAHEEQLSAAVAGHDYPHRIGRAEYGPHGIGVWSRYPLTDTVVLPSDTRLGLLTIVDVDGLPVRLLAAHPPPPIQRDGLRDWLDGLRYIEDVVGPPSGRTIIIGDFNASRWHPPFRRLLNIGWRSAHEVVGQRFGGTWPTDRWYLPAFVRLDHVLLGDLVAAETVRDLDIAGSDHRGVVVSLALLR